MAAKVVVALLSEHQDFQQIQAKEARDAAARAGLECEVVFAEDNAIQQIHQLFAYIHAPEPERPAAIVVETVVGEGLERVARNAVKAGIGWVILNRLPKYLDVLRKERTDLPVGSVSVDNEEVGRIQGRQVRALLPGGGRVLCLQGPADTETARQRLHGLTSTIEGAGVEMKVLDNDRWTEESGEKTASAWMRLKTSEAFRPALVCAQNDSLAIGARRAFLALRPEASDVLFMGCDGLPEGGQKAVRAGELTATVVTPPPAGAAVTLVARVLAGERAIPVLRLPPQSFPSVEELARLRR